MNTATKTEAQIDALLELSENDRQTLIDAYIESDHEFLFIDRDYLLNEVFQGHVAAGGVGGDAYYEYLIDALLGGCLSPLSYLSFLEMKITSYETAIRDYEITKIEDVDFREYG